MIMPILRATRKQSKRTRNAIIATQQLPHQPHQGARWHRPTHCVSIRGGQDASASRPNRRTDQGYFSIVLRLVASQNILLSDAAGPRVLHGANLVEVNFRRAARGHALLPRHITHSGAGPRLPLTGFRVCTYNPEITNVSGFQGPYLRAL